VKRAAIAILVAILAATPAMAGDTTFAFLCAGEAGIPVAGAWQACRTVSFMSNFFQFIPNTGMCRPTEKPQFQGDGRAQSHSEQEPTAPDAARQRSAR